MRDHYDFKGMKVLQFAFDPLETNNDFPDRENMILYTGTHDNQTVMGWYRGQSEKFRRATLCELRKDGYTEGKVSDRFICSALNSVAAMTVVPMWDFLGMDDNSRMNTPGTVGSPNWEWRLKSFTPFQKRISWINEQIQKSDR